ncbi:MAG TPA: DinB family protein [Actinomycetota bacterium]|nr:DinB family protein [Actinomycetota bacterium]
MQTRYGVPVSGGEKEVLAGFLDHYRKTMLQICSGVSDEDLRRPMVPSGTSLLGMIKHLAWVERGWFQEGVANEPVDYPFPDDDPDADFRIEPDETTEEILELYRGACDRSRRALAEASLDDMLENPNRHRDYNVRWVVVHMIEETARHAGHADILREQIDGTIGAGYGPD